MTLKTSTAKQQLSHESSIAADGPAAGNSQNSHSLVPPCQSGPTSFKKMLQCSWILLVASNPISHKQQRIGWLIREAGYLVWFTCMSPSTTLNTRQHKVMYGMVKDANPQDSWISSSGLWPTVLTQKDRGTTKVTTPTTHNSPTLRSETTNAAKQAPPTYSQVGNHQSSHAGPSHPLAGRKPPTQPSSPPPHDKETNKNYQDDDTTRQPGPNLLR